MKLYSVRDVKADAFNAPMSVVSEGIAKRGFLEACQQPNSPLAKYPEDYSLYEVGSFDPESGKVEGILPTPKFICSAASIVAEAKAARAAVEPELPGVA